MCSELTCTLGGSRLVHPDKCNLASAKDASAIVNQVEPCLRHAQLVSLIHQPPAITCFYGSVECWIMLTGPCPSVLSVSCLALFGQLSLSTHKDSTLVV